MIFIPARLAYRYELKVVLLHLWRVNIKTISGALVGTDIPSALAKAL